MSCMLIVWRPRRSEALAGLVGCASGVPSEDHLARWPTCRDQSLGRINQVSTLRDMSVSTADETIRAAALREAMVEEMRKLGTIRSDSVAAAVGTVPRHLFAPGEPLERTY